MTVKATDWEAVHSRISLWRMCAGGTETAPTGERPCPQHLTG
jgi:hypothetical protein